MAAPFAATAQTFDDVGGAFRQSLALPTAAGPYVPAVGDLNGDGRPDLVVGQADADAVAVRLANGSGGFLAATTYPAGDGPEGVAIADLNNDGKPDLVAANLFSSTVSVWLGNGAGAFTPAPAVATGANPHAVVAADFNGDGKADLAVANGSAGTASILLGNGNGSFAAAVAYVSGVNPRDIASADFNGDGKRDLAITNEGGDNLAVLLGNGAGGFGPPTTYPAGDAPQTVSIGDLNADGKPDLVVACANDNKLIAFLGQGNGSFVAQPAMGSAHALSGAALADLDGNGAPDLLAVRYDTLVEIRMGLGNGSFGAMIAVAPGGSIVHLAVADLDADTRPDLVGTGTAGSDAALLVAFNDSALLDIPPSATVDRGSSYTLRKQPIWIDRQAPGPYPESYFSHAGYADIDRDGDIDVLRSFSNNDLRFPVQVLVNDGAGGLSDETATRIVGSQPGIEVTRKILVGDYNGDGWPDFFLAPHGIDAPPFPGEYPQLFLSNGDGTLHYQPGLETQVGYHHGGASADIDGNGTVDILVSNGADGPYLLLNDGTARFAINTSRLPVPADGQPYSFISAEFADIDGDGYIDLVSDGYEPNGRYNTVYWGNSSGSYRSSRSTPLPVVPDMGVTLDFAIEDIDHDGRKDLLVVRTGSTQLYVGRAIQVLRQTAARSFADQTASRITMDTSLPVFDFLRAQDFNGDGWVDLFIDDKHDVANGQYAWVNDGTGVFTPYGGPIILKGPPMLAVSDPSVAEGNAGTQILNFTVSVSPVATQAVSFDAFTTPGTATPGVDYQAANYTGLSIPGGQASVQVPVAINGDTAVEGHETLTLNLANAVNASIRDAQGRGRIANDDLAGLSIRDAGVVEGNSGTTTLAFAIELSKPMPNPVYFDIATGGGSATAGNDYVARSQTGRFMDAGRTRQWFEVAVKGDGAVEPDESIVVTLGNVSGAVLQDGSATGTIANDDGAPLRAAKARSSATPLRVPRAAAARDRSVKP